MLGLMLTLLLDTSFGGHQFRKFVLSFKALSMKSRVVYIKSRLKCSINLTALSLLSKILYMDLEVVS